jgi:hypothetical protein
MRTAAAAAGVALLSFFLYHATLLPGLDFGDTPSFQVMGGERAITPRDGYPLYFAIGSVFVRAAGDPAHGLNLASAVEAAAASGVIVAVAAELAGSILAGIAAALLFAGSYTFWSQAVITEVYSLHELMVALTLWLLLRWERRPTLPRLAAFFAVFAIGFGNHLSMVLLLPGYTLFLLASAPGGWRSMLTPRIIALASAFAAIGALQYAWNIHSLWLAPVQPASLAGAMRTFWFDVTKSDWRDTMMASVPRAMAAERLRMYIFDVTQQFGVAVPVVAMAGAIHLFRTAPRRAWLVFVLFIVNVVFALTYNVGDSHVFFIPSHLMIALFAAPGLVLIGALLTGPAEAGHLVPRSTVAALAVLLAGWRIYDNYPALDRSGDTRPTDVLSAVTSGLDDRHSVLVADLSWQMENGLTYFAKDIRPEVAFTRMPDVLLYAPAFVRDNLAIGRDVALTERAREELTGAYGSLFTIEPDPRVATPSLVDLTRDLPLGTPYVLSVLKPSDEFSIDRNDLQNALQSLWGGRPGDAAARSVPDADYVAVAGVVGNSPDVVLSDSRPFRASVHPGGIAIEIRMESWLAFDTIRRMGFGQVVARRQHALIIERGVSFVALRADATALRRGYTAGLFAPQARYLVRGMALP